MYPLSDWCISSCLYVAYYIVSGFWSYSKFTNIKFELFVDRLIIDHMRPIVHASTTGRSFKIKIAECKSEIFVLAWLFIIFVGNIVSNFFWWRLLRHMLWIDIALSAQCWGTVQLHWFTSTGTGVNNLSFWVKAMCLRPHWLFSWIGLTVNWFTSPLLCIVCAVPVL